MQKPTSQDLEACARLQAHERGFTEFLKRRLQQRQTDMMKHEDTVKMRQAQGRAQELADLLELIEGAGDLLRKP